MELELSYRYAFGEYYDRFFRELRDNRRIMGVACSRCGAVLLPPRPYCGFCFEPAEEWVEVSDEGTVVLLRWSTRRPSQPAEPPYVCVIMLTAPTAVPPPGRRAAPGGRGGRHEGESSMGAG
jgi:uncharacterized OB-fold protein